MNRIEIKLIANRALDSGRLEGCGRGCKGFSAAACLTCHYVSAAYLPELRNYPIKAGRVGSTPASPPPPGFSLCNTCQQVLLYSTQYHRYSLYLWVPLSVSFSLHCFHFHSCSTFGNPLLSFRFRNSRLWLYPPHSPSPLYLPLLLFLLFVLVKYTTRYVFFFVLFCVFF